MMRLLTGVAATSASDSFEFVPLSVTSFGSTVIVEGCDHARAISWVHAWTVTNGIITQCGWCLPEHDGDEWNQDGDTQLAIS
ncbi:senescence associated gene 20-like [Carica papaya]|uniref:senescence associated gene 20-like n=1 Tax=Carica papaya TaxID=3649 RepID=UPI000B8CF5BE|nr:senescence associated gene 20-like [Carica papaya]